MCGWVAAREVVRRRQLPGGLRAAGAGLQLASLFGSRTLSVALLSILHLWLPPIAGALARLLRLGAQETTILPVFASVPPASSAYVLAARKCYDDPEVAGLVTLSTLLGMLSLPLALVVLRGW